MATTEDEKKEKRKKSYDKYINSEKGRIARKESFKKKDKKINEFLKITNDIFYKSYKNQKTIENAKKKQSDSLKTATKKRQMGSRGN